MSETNAPPAGFKSGFVLLAGAPNVGKSTLLNRILGEKLSITSKKAQTTRNRIIGIRHGERSQMVFMDTPGVHRSTLPMNVRMVEVALTAIADADVILFLLDLGRPDPDAEEILSRRLADQRRPVILVLNKRDLVPDPVILAAIDAWRVKNEFADIVPISAERGDQVDDLIAAIETRLPEGPPYFPEDAVTDMPERFIASEMIREKVFRLTGQEIPYASAVTVESFKEGEKGVTIHATIHVERDSQKAIVIGRQGSKLREIGETARNEIAGMLGTRVHLQLFVRVQKNWRRDSRAIRNFGY